MCTKLYWSKRTDTRKWILPERGYKLKQTCLLVWMILKLLCSLYNQRTTHLVWIVGPHSHESSKLILIHPSIYLVPSFGGTLISERQGRRIKSVREHWWDGLRGCFVRRGFEGFWRRWTQRRREKSGTAGGGGDGVENHPSKWIFMFGNSSPFHSDIRMKYCVQFYISEHP